MVRRIVFAAALAAAWGAPARAADPPVAIVDFGTYHATATGYVKSPGTIAGIEGRAAGIALERRTDTVLGQMGRFFGLRFRVDDPALDGKLLTLRIVHPRLVNPETGRGGTVTETARVAAANRATETHLYRFDFRWEIGEGDWVFQIVHDGRVLAEKTLRVVVSLN